MASMDGLCLLLSALSRGQFINRLSTKRSLDQVRAFNRFEKLEVFMAM